jgi:hypothetical protein
VALDEHRAGAVHAAPPGKKRSRRRPGTAILRLYSPAVVRGAAIRNLFAALLLFGALAHVASAAPRAAAPGNDAALPKLDVTGDALQRAVSVFVAKLTGAAVTSDDQPIGLWASPICPLVAGLRRAEGQELFDGFVAAVDAVGLTRGGVGCRPNFVIVVTATPEADLNSWRKRLPLVFGEPAQMRRLLATARPVRVWYNTNLSGSDGVPGSASAIFEFGGIFGSAPTFVQHGSFPRFEFSVVPHLDSVVALVDIDRVVGFDWRQIAAYIAMSGLTQVNLDADPGDAPTILRLFSTEATGRPIGLTAWDLSFLRDLYHTSAIDRHQRVEVAKRMVQDLSLVKTN